MKSNPLAKYNVGDNTKQNYDSFDLHKPFVDNIVLVSSTGKAMRREPDLIDVWFDSGAMPYAQVHYMGCPTPALPKGEGEKKAPKYQTARASVYPLLKQLAEDKKKNQTPAEEILWEQLRGKQLESYKFRRQHVIDEFIVDFACLEKRLIIEVDGGYHKHS